MPKSFNKLKKLLPCAISRDAAKQIARDAFASSFDSMQVYDALQPGWYVYLPSCDEPCWFVTIPSVGSSLLQSSNVVVISRKTGKVLYCGSACDEG